MPEPTHRREPEPGRSGGGLVPRGLVQPVQRFLHTESASGIVLVIAAVVAIVWANSAWADSYEQRWSTSINLGIGSHGIHESLQGWINDGAMALFFFVVGLEIKRELVFGELRQVRSAILPVACAIGGMVVPALIYATVNAGGPAARGWGIPMATDIAFAVGVLALVGPRAPAPLKIFLLTLAVVDDIGAIVVIAVFYSHGVHLGWLAAAVAGVLLVVALRRIGVHSLVPYAVLAVVVWVCTLESGVHATLAGVVLGLLTPARPLHRATTARPHDEADDEGVSPLTRLETALHPWSAYVVLPLFALANAGMKLPDDLAGRFGAPVTLGVILGLVVGKPLGIVVAAVATTRITGAPLPGGCRWRDLVGVAALAGIGFTVSLFITDLALTGDEADGAKIGILAASVLASGLGALVLLTRRTSDPHVAATTGS